jgi:ABC-type antimicrobial peptide transport system permease subunit
LKIASRDLWRRKVRTSLVILALGLAIAILIAIPSATRAYSNSVQTAIENQASAYQSFISMSANEIIVEPPTENFQGGPGFGEGFPGTAFVYRNINVMDEDMAVNIASIPGVDAVVPQLQGSLQLQGIENQEYRARLTVMGILTSSSIDEKYHVQPDNVVEGRKLNENESGSVLLGIELENYFNSIGVYFAVGQSVTLGNYSFLVVGIFNSGNRFANQYAYVNLADAQTMFDQSGKVSQIQVYADSVDDVNNIANGIVSAYGDNVSVETASDELNGITALFQGTENTTNSQLAQMNNVASQEILIAIIVGGLIVFLTMIYAVRERTKEIGIFKALGFTNWNITSQFMLEGAIIGLIGGLIGVLIGSFGAPFLSTVLLPHVSLPTGFSGRFVISGGSGGRFNPASQQSTTRQLTVQVTPDASLILFTLGIAVFLGVVGSLYPSWWASRKRPAEALKYE